MIHWQSGIVERFAPPQTDTYAQKNEKPGVEGENEEGRKALLTIKGKLGGQINKEELPLSAEGQVDELIRMATAPDRLVQMYIGTVLPFPYIRD